MNQKTKFNEIEKFAIHLSLVRHLWTMMRLISNRGGVEDTRLEAKAKDTKKFWGQGKGQNLSRPRTQALVFSKKKKVLQNIFSGEKSLQKFFFRRSLLEETKKKVFADFPQGFWRKFQQFKNSAVLEPRTRQFSRTWGFEAKAKDFKMCSRGLHLGFRIQNWNIKLRYFTLIIGWTCSFVFSNN